MYTEWSILNSSSLRLARDWAGVLLLALVAVPGRADDICRNLCPPCALDVVRATGACPTCDQPIRAVLPLSLTTPSTSTTTAAGVRPATATTATIAAHV